MTTNFCDLSKRRSLFYSRAVAQNRQNYTFVVHEAKRHRGKHLATVIFSLFCPLAHLPFKKVTNILVVVWAAQVYSISIAHTGLFLSNSSTLEWRTPTLCKQRILWMIFVIKRFHPSLPLSRSIPLFLYITLFIYFLFLPC